MKFLETLSDSELERMTQLIIVKIKEHVEASSERWVRGQINTFLNSDVKELDITPHDKLEFKLNLNIDLKEVFSRLGISCVGGSKK